MSYSLRGRADSAASESKSERGGKGTPTLLEDVSVDDAELTSLLSTSAHAQSDQYQDDFEAESMSRDVTHVSAGHGVGGVGEGKETDDVTQAVAPPRSVARPASVSSSDGKASDEGDAMPLTVVPSVLVSAPTTAASASPIAADASTQRTPAAPSPLTARPPNAEAARHVEAAPPRLRNEGKEEEGEEEKEVATQQATSVPEASAEKVHACISTSGRRNISRTTCRIRFCAQRCNGGGARADGHVRK
ncbi:hypothetical protein EON62_03315 [archaeon]|nr:MAG: hypothetical protein EON62_03315 [archaeon]